MSATKNIRKAYKSYDCYECGDKITPKDKYLELRIVIGGVWEKRRLCKKCAGLDLVSSAWRKAQAVYTCGVCKRGIERGEEYLSAAKQGKRGIINYKLCQDCCF